MKKITWLAIVLSLVLSIHMPAYAGNVIIRNKCARDIKYSFTNNSNFGTWKIVDSGTVGAGEYVNQDYSDVGICVVAVQYQFYKYEIQNSATSKWDLHPTDDILLDYKECVITGCPWLQCGAATITLEPGPERTDRNGSKIRECQARTTR
jgi:hypothetical protein